MLLAILLPLACGSGAPPASTPAGADSGGADTVGPGAGALAFDGGRPRNLIIISVDTLRRDHVGRWDPTGDSATPFLDSLLAQGVPLEDNRSCSNWTFSSFLCLYTARSTVELGYEPVSGDDRAPPAPEILPILPVWLHDLGYRTAAVSGSPFLAPGQLLDQDWDSMEYVDLGRLHFAQAEWVAVTGAERAQALVGDGSGSPFFLHVHFMDPHTPYDTPEQYLGALADLEPIPYDVTDPQDLGQIQKDFRGLDPSEQEAILAWLDAWYRGEASYFDDWLKRLWGDLDAMGALDDTLVMFWSDHGEQFYERHRFGHGKALYAEEGMTLAGFWARNIDPVPWTGPTMHQDLVPTIFQALGLPADDSWSGLPLDQVPEDRPRLAFRYEDPSPPQSGVDVEGMHLVYSWNGRKSFYDDLADPFETDDIYDPADPRVVELWGLLGSQIEQVRAYMPFLRPVDPGP